MLIPLSYGDHPGGTMNHDRHLDQYPVDGVAGRTAWKPFGMFDIFLPGFDFMAVIGVGFILLWATRLLLTVKAFQSSCARDQSRPFMTTCLVRTDSQRIIQSRQLPYAKTQLQERIQVRENLRRADRGAVHPASTPHSVEGWATALVLQPNMHRLLWSCVKKWTADVQPETAANFEPSSNRDVVLAESHCR